MTPEMEAKVIDLAERGYTPGRIAVVLGVWVTSVRYVLRRGYMLERSRKKRRTAGALPYRCGKCGELGHNRRGCSK